MRVLCDTNVLVRAVMPPTGPAAELLTILAGNAHPLVTSSAVLAEVSDVLRRRLWPPRWYAQ
jgi:predicted nucleic acid-binding protein